ncbi:VanZ family protein, partial [Streptococcus pneumoniae]
MLESKKTTRYVFYVYLMLLTWGILFKFETNPEFIAFFLAPRYINWIPFSEPLIVDGKIVFAEMLFNLIFFIPLGVCFPLIKTNLSSLRIVGTGFLISLLDLFGNCKKCYTIFMETVYDKAQKLNSKNFKL